MNITPEISRNFRQADRTGIEVVSQLLKHHYFSRSYLEERHTHNLEAFLSSPAGKTDFYNHLHRRFDTFRKTIIPWLNDAKPLSGSTILEIGCGTGSSTVALAEQGSTVYAIDIEEDSLEVAKGRCHAYGVSAKFSSVSAVEIGRLFAKQHLILSFSSRLWST